MRAPNGCGYRGICPSVCHLGMADAERVWTGASRCLAREFGLFQTRPCSRHDWGLDGRVCRETRGCAATCTGAIPVVLCACLLMRLRCGRADREGSVRPRSRSDLDALECQTSPDTIRGTPGWVRESLEFRGVSDCRSSKRMRSVIELSRP